MGRKQKMMPIINRFAAGVDVGAAGHFVCASVDEKAVIRRFPDLSAFLFLI
jgi:hypothetical protein